MVRVTGTDLLSHFAKFDVDAFGIDADLLPEALRPTHEHVSFAGNLKPTGSTTRRRSDGFTSA